MSHPQNPLFTPPPPLCPLANIFCSPAHIGMTLSLKVGRTVTLRNHRRLTWITARWATHKSNHKRLVTKKKKAKQSKLCCVYYSYPLVACMSHSDFPDAVWVTVVFPALIYVRIPQRSLIQNWNYLNVFKERNLPVRMQPLVLHIVQMLQGYIPFSRCSLDLTQPTLCLLYKSEPQYRRPAAKYDNSTHRAQALQYFALVLVIMQ